MEHTWRWFGPADPISLSDIRQTDATGIVTALHHIPNGDVWPVDEIRARKAEVEAAGLTWSVVESVPIHEHIKWGGPRRDAAVANWVESIRNLAAAGLGTVCYNFMPVLDWTRTDLSWLLPSGGRALRFSFSAYAAFDLHILRRAGAEADYSASELAEAERVAKGLTETEREALTATILAGLPGAEESYTLDTFRAALQEYDGVTADTLRANLAAFLREVLPIAEALGVRLAIHPDDPPRALFGLPRVVSTADDARAVLSSSPSPSNGLTLCVGSYGSRPDNDVVAMAREFASRIYFAHLRNVEVEPDGKSFFEASHIGGSSDMVAVISALLDEEERREATHEPQPRIPMRPDHGHVLLDDANRRTNPGYSLIGRLKGLAELRGVELALTHSRLRQS